MKKSDRRAASLPHRSHRDDAREFRELFCRNGIGASTACFVPPTVLFSFFSLMF